jgi:calcium channel MID1
VIFDLPFCTDVAYAVPTNPENSTLSSAQTLAETYDNFTASLYQNFTFSLQQIPCDTSSSSQYSLARNCNDCARDYKTWLCAVTIPRCTDFSTTGTFLAPRNIGKPFPNGTEPDLEAFGINGTMKTSMHTNSSRNPLIDNVIKPGPYKELLPCKELCYDMVQSCPMALGFGCPKQGSYFGKSYGEFDRGRIMKEGEGAVTCNYLGVDWPTLSGGGSLSSSKWMVGVAALVMIWLSV